MASRINPVDPSAFAPAVFVDRNGTRYRKMPGGKRKVPQSVRKNIYELDLTVRECKAEIRRLLVECGVSDDHWANQMARIRKERGR